MHSSDSLSTGIVPARGGIRVHSSTTWEVGSMFRKFFAAAVALALVVGGLFADEVKGVFKKYEDGKVTVEVDGKEKTYKVSTDAKVKFKDKEFALTDSFKRYKDGAKITLTVDKDVVTAAKGERPAK